MIFSYKKLVLWADDTLTTHPILTSGVSARTIMHIQRVVVLLPALLGAR